MRHYAKSMPVYSGGQRQVELREPFHHDAHSIVPSLGVRESVLAVEEAEKILGGGEDGAEKDDGGGAVAGGMEQVWSQGVQRAAAPAMPAWAP